MKLVGDKNLGFSLQPFLYTLPENLQEHSKSCNMNYDHRYFQIFKWSTINGDTCNSSTYSYTTGERQI